MGEVGAEVKGRAVIQCVRDPVSIHCLSSQQTSSRVLGVISRYFAVTNKQRENSSVPAAELLAD